MATPTDSPTDGPTGSPAEDTYGALHNAAAAALNELIHTDLISADPDDVRQLLLCRAAAIGALADRAEHLVGDRNRHAPPP